jgi:lipid II:glycine glycyltransferase (peptidoglycan interpeptide bridge formation enzyme)
MQTPEAVYHEAASTEESRKLPGAYALQWRVIRDAKDLGFKRYNLFGIAPPNTPNHRYAGVTTFKTGFGGEQIAYLPAHDLIIRPFRYKFVRVVEDIRKKRRHL